MPSRPATHHLRLANPNLGFSLSIFLRFQQRTVDRLFRHFLHFVFPHSMALIGLVPLMVLFVTLSAGCSALGPSTAATPTAALAEPGVAVAPASGFEVTAKLPSLAGTPDGQFLVLDSRGSRLSRLRETGVDTIDLRLPDDSDWVFASDLWVQDDRVYLMATQTDAVYFVSLHALQVAWSSHAPPVPAIAVSLLQPNAPQWHVVQQHFLRTGLWLPGQTRAALLARAKSLAQAGWPVRMKNGTDSALRYAVHQGAHGELCIQLQAISASQTSVLCRSLPAGWQVGAVYPIALRAPDTAAPPVACAGAPLPHDAQWLWIAVDLVGESTRSIETRTLLMRAAVTADQLACFDANGHMADAPSSARLQRIYALVGAQPYTLKNPAPLRWQAAAVPLAPNFWPDPLVNVRPQFSFASMPSAVSEEELNRALGYAQLRWQLPNDAAARARYTDWSNAGFFNRCFPEIADCAKPLAPRYLASGLVQKTYVGVPYGWGVADTPERFLERIALGDYPGDIHTNQTILTSVAGADCSGFLGVVWRLPQRVATTCRGGLDPWTPKAGDGTCVGAYAKRVGREAAQQGDVLLTPGHVRWVVQGVESTLQAAGRGLYAEIVESSGFCAGTCHRLLPVRAMANYRLMRQIATDELPQAAPAL